MADMTVDTLTLRPMTSCSVLERGVSGGLLIVM
jgi:hypothetical protein